jgi:hypothetical protein
MSAIGGPDEHSHTEQQDQTFKQPNLPESAFDYDSYYEPEREFVLMPLFRRLGAMLGFRREKEPEYVYEAGQSTFAPEPEQPGLRNSEPQQQLVLPETAIQYSEPQLPAESQSVISSAPVLNDQTHEEPGQQAGEEHRLRRESDSPQAIDFVQQPAKELQESHFEGFDDQLEQDSSPAPLMSEEPADEPLIAARSEAPEMEPAHSAMEEWPALPEVATVSPEHARKRNPDEVRQLVAPLREAAAKITLIVAQAAEWLRAKEEEFLRSTEAVAAESKSLRPSSMHPNLQIEDSAQSAMSLQNEVPGLQRELGWREKSEHTVADRAPQSVPIQFVAKPDRPMTAPSVPIWKRINWSEEFTPKRVAVLGGLAMAVLLVLGISLARRPASSVLPEQQTRSIESGGVTVTAHPVAAPVAPHVVRKTSVTPRSPAPQRRSRRLSAEAYDDEPDVVIHHYDTAKKPSPVKQTTVAGVRHYSDM